MCPFDWRWTHSKATRTIVPRADGDVLKLFLSGALGAYLWSMLAPTDTFRNVGHFDENLPRLQDLDFLIRFARSGGSIRVAGREPLCVYNKDDSDRSGRVVAGSLSQIWAKHRPLYLQYGRIFALSCRVKHHSLAARHSFRNEGGLLGWYYSGRALALKLARFAIIVSTPKAFVRRVANLGNISFFRRLRCRSK